MLMDRAKAADLGRQTVRILEAGSYQTATGKTVDIRAPVERSVEGTRSYPPEQSLPEIQRGVKPIRIEVANETTLAAALGLVEEGQSVVALNFASAKNPGGGFLTGARAQEESLVRSSGLYACLASNPMYDFHRARGDAMYTNYAIYSPNVPIIRTDEGTLLEQPWLCSFITSPAVNAKVVLERDSSRRSEIREAMRERVRKVLTVAAVHRHDALILGAWRCGAFGNDGENIAELFREELSDRFRGVFERVVFAITDWSKEQRFIRPFQSVFERPSD